EFVPIPSTGGYTVNVTPNTTFSYGSSYAVEYNVSTTASTPVPISNSYTFTTAYRPAASSLYAGVTSAQSGYSSPATLSGSTVMVSAVFNDVDSGDASSAYELQLSEYANFSSL